MDKQPAGQVVDLTQPGQPEPTGQVTVNHGCWLPARNQATGNVEYWLARCQHGPVGAPNVEINLFWQWSERRDAMRPAEVTLYTPEEEYPGQVAQGVIPQVDPSVFFRR